MIAFECPLVLGLACLCFAFYIRAHEIQGVPFWLIVIAGCLVWFVAAISATFVITLLTKDLICYDEMTPVACSRAQFAGETLFLAILIWPGMLLDTSKEIVTEPLKIIAAWGVVLGTSAIGWYLFLRMLTLRHDIQQRRVRRERESFGIGQDG